MTKLYKLTNKKHQTRNNTQWGEGITHTASGSGELCSGGWLHAYTDPLLAVLLNPIHAAIKHPVLWECEGEVGKSDHGLKVGCARLTTIRQIELPVITCEQRVTWAILCVLGVYKYASFSAWAADWMSGKDRSEVAADRAALDARSARSASPYAAEAAAYAAARTADAAASIAHAVDAYDADVYDYAYAVDAAAICVADAVSVAASAYEIDLAGIAKKAMS
jgi:hypothetical protein